MPRARSKGEQRVQDILEWAKVPYQSEKTFPDLKGYKKTPLRFDFYLKHPKYGWCCLEYHGAQHYRYDSYFSKTRSDFRYRQQLDVKKCSYCLANDIPLFIIPFTEYENLHGLKDLFQDRFRVKEREHARKNNPFSK